MIEDEVIGSLGASELLDRNVARETRGLLEEGKTTVRRFGADGATLGDELRVHIRAYAPPPQMFIFGAIDFSAALAPFARADRLRGDDLRRPRSLRPLAAVLLGRPRSRSAGPRR